MYPPAGQYTHTCCSMSYSLTPSRIATAAKAATAARSPVAACSLARSQLACGALHQQQSHSEAPRCLCRTNDESGARPLSTALHCRNDSRAGRRSRALAPALHALIRGGATSVRDAPPPAAAADGARSGAAPGSWITDLRLELWSSLLQATATQVSTAATSAAAALATSAGRLQRMASPPPPGFPPGPPGDQTLPLITDALPFLESTTARYGPVVGLMLGGERVALVSGREEARAVLIDQSDVYVKEGTAFFPGSSLAGNGLLVSDGEVWRRQRRLSNPAFRRAAVEAYGAAMVSLTGEMLDGAWSSQHQQQGGGGAERDVYADFNALTLRITLEALFGARLAGRGADGSSAASSGGALYEETQEAAVVVSAVERAFRFFTQRAASGFIIPEWLPTLDNIEFAAAVQQLDRVVYGLIDRRRAELVAAHGSVAAAAAAISANTNGNGGTSGVQNSLLTSLLISRDEDGSGMTDTALRDELMTLLIAGQETSAILLGWACALLAAHPEVQERAQREVVQAVGTTQPPTPASVRQLPYLESVVLEALRLYSPAYMVGRCARCDTRLGGYSLPAGTTVLVAPYIMHRSPDVWDDPQAFRPERWAAVQNRDGYQGYMSLMSNLGPNGAYLPFGGGPRNCVGTGFAMMEAMLVLAAALQRYDLMPPADGSFPKPMPLLTLRPEAVRLRPVPRRG